MLRRATTIWHWPYCISVEEKTFEHLINAVNLYWDVSNGPTSPFDSVK